MGKQNKGRFKVRAFPSIDQTPTDTTTATASTASTISQNPNDDSAMSVDAVDSSSATLAPTSPTITLSRPFNPPHSTLHPSLASTSAPSLTSITLPAAVPASRPLNGRQWRNPTAQPNRSLTTAHSKSWARTQSTRQQRITLRAKTTEMDALATELRLAERRKREQRAAMKKVNEKKNRVVQVIKDSSKIKRMSRAQLKMIEKA